MHINITYLALRRNLGILGILLPFLLMAGASRVEPTISHYYYTNMSVIFTGILVSFGLFLFSYRGYPRQKEVLSDNWLTNLAGVLAIITAIIPTACRDLAIDCTGANGHQDTVRNHTHLASASLFFVIMGWMAVFRFTKSKPRGEKNKQPDPQECDEPHKKDPEDPCVKIRRNRVYYTCGIGIWLILFLLGVEKLTGFEFGESDILVGETAALVMFGSAWLVKGKALKRLGI